MDGSSLTASLRETLAVFDGSDRGTPLTTSEVAERVALGRRSTYDRLERLAERDLVATKKVGARGRVWWRPPDGSGSTTSGRGDDEPDHGSDRELLDRILEASPIAVAVFDDDGGAIQVNQRFADYLGFDGDPDEYTIGDRPVFDEDGAVIPPSDRPVQRALATGEPVTDRRVQVDGSDGSTQWLSVNVEPFHDDAGGVVIAMTDVTRLQEQARRLERRREEVESELQHVFDRVDDAFWAIDDEWRFTYINDRAEDILERSEAELVGANVWEALPWLSDLNARDGFEEAMATGRTVHFEDHVEATGRWYDVRCYPSETGLSVYYQDVTERKERQRALEASERNNRALVDNFPNGAVALFEEDLTHLVVGGDLVGGPDVAAADLEGRTPREVLDPAMVDQLEPHFEAVFEGESRDFEIEHRGRIRRFHTHPIRDEAGEIVAGLGMSQDVTERRRRERDLERYETIVETVGDGIYAIDEGANFVLANDAFCEMVGYERAELMGRHATVVHNDDVDRSAERLSGEVESGERDLATLEFDLRTESGDRVPVESRFAPYPVGDGFGRCGVVRDVSDRVERERELERYVGILDAVGEPVYELDDAGRFTFVNDAMVEHSGYSEAELLGAHVSIGMADDAVERVQSEMARLLDEGDVDRTTIEYEVLTRGGERVPVENRVSIRTDEDGTFRGSAGLLWDVSERIEREAELERTLDLLDRTEDVADVGGWEIDVETREVYWTEQLFDLLEIPYGEEPPIDGALDVYHPEDRPLVERAIDEALATGDSFDEEVRFQTSADEVRWARIWGVPDVVDGEVTSLRGAFQDVTERKERERELEHQRARLTALDDLNGVVREITDAVIEQSTRAEIERIVCERLAGSDSYRFAWIGDVDGHTDTVDLRAEAGVEGYLDGITISVDPDDERRRGPTGRALIEREVQVVRDSGDDPRHAPWREALDEYDFRSSAAIPILHEGTRFGVLNVYADRADAFDEDEQAVIGQLGEVVGHAIAALERKQALTSDEVVELEFKIPDFFGGLAAGATADGSVTFEQAVPIGEDSQLVYGTATGGALAAIEAAVEDTSFEHWRSVNVLWERGEETRFELNLVESPLIATVGSHGGYVHEARVDDGDYYMRLHLVPGTDVRAVVDAIESIYPTLVMVTRQQVRRSGPGRAAPRGAPLDALTDRQRSAVESAYYSGYFETSRNSSGGDVAASLGIDPSTFHYHLREAEREIIGAVLGAGT